jgi:hypothetical protein
MNNLDGNEDSSEYSTPEGDEYSLPLLEIPTSDAKINTIQPIIPANPQKYVGPNLADNSREENRDKDEGEMTEPKGPLLVRVIKDDDLSSFETKTVRVAWFGFGVAVLSFIITAVSLLAACAAGTLSTNNGKR